MPAHDLAAAGRPGNPVDILQLAAAALRVVSRRDVSAVEVHATAAGQAPVVIVLAPVQAVALAARLLGAALADPADSTAAATQSTQ